jgi:hypothetical protein
MQTRSRRPDARSDEAATYRRLYNTARWKRTRLAQLRTKPLCERCDAAGFTIAATICDHAKPHKGDPEAFYNGPFVSLCKPCHDGPKQAEERTDRPSKRIGYAPDTGTDGLPRDPRHPFFAGG